MAIFLSAFAINFFLLKINPSMQLYPVVANPENLQDDVPVVSLLYSTEIIKIKTTYRFTYPRVTIRAIGCSYNRDQNDQCQSANLSASELCIPYEDKRSQGFISIWIKPEPDAAMMRAYKLNRKERSAFNVFRITHHGISTKTDIPTGINQFLINDDLAFQMKQQPFTNILGEYEWYYAEEDSNNLRTGVQINEKDEFNPKKLGWFRPYLSKLDLQNNYNVTYYHCTPPLYVKDHLDAVSFYNDNGLLRNEVKGSIVEELSEKISEIIIDKNENIIRASFSTDSETINNVSLVSREKIFLFKASIKSTNYGDNILSLVIKENCTGQVFVQIGFASANGMLCTKIFHKGKPEVYEFRLSSFLRGKQWVCLFPLTDITKKTCRLSTYIIETMVTKEKVIHFSNFEIFNLSQMPETGFNQSSTFYFNAKMNTEIKLNEIFITIIALSSVILLFCILAAIYKINTLKNCFFKRIHSSIENDSETMKL